MMNTESTPKTGDLYLAYRTGRQKELFWMKISPPAISGIDFMCFRSGLNIKDRKKEENCSD
ncbi:MAG: hypothetical protein L3J52_04615, partial [Proteobacteria bacterium]|nr:hypothetical protein [Pseudomonadota bacterium]